MNWEAVKLTRHSLEILELDACPPHSPWLSKRVKTRWHPYSILGCNLRFRTTWQLYTLPTRAQEIKKILKSIILLLALLHRQHAGERWWIMLSFCWTLCLTGLGSWSLSLTFFAVPKRERSCIKVLHSSSWPLHKPSSSTVNGRPLNHQGFCRCSEPLLHPK